MRWEWDPAKAESNQHKHGIDFADAVTVFDDDQAVTIEDIEHDEQRFITLGLDAGAQLVVVVYTWRAGTVRIISARKANRRESRKYGEQVKR